MRNFALFIKRCLDILLALILLILLIPLWIIIPILIKIDSPGRVIYTQKRVGINSGYFTIYKYRTMKEGTPDIPTDKVENPQELVTKFGRFLRRTSIDEIPQLINILKGQMSFIGPRPALYNQPELISLRKEKGVDKMRPGITGLAQVSGRDDLPIPVKVEYDKRYVDNFSLLNDFKILIITVKAVFTAKGNK
ncbi:MAG: sugar transferase [Cyanobacteria bacterium]|nr:sugar transferase [Cyanobacteriota bacterium]